MEDLIQLRGIKGVLSHSGCPSDLLERYLTFLRTGGQQVQIVRGEVNMMFQKELQYRQRRNEEMRGKATFCKNKKSGSGNSDTGVFIGMEFIQCCFCHGIPARMLDVRRERGEVVEVVVGFGG